MLNPAGEGKKVSGKISKRQLRRMGRGWDLKKLSQSVKLCKRPSVLEPYPNISYSMWECLKTQLLTQTGLSAEQVTLQYQHI